MFDQLRRSQYCISRADIERIADAATMRRGRDRAIVLLFAHGLRRTEAAAARLDGWSSDGRTLFVTGKGGKRRVVCIGARLAHLLENTPWMSAREKAGTPFFFPARNTRGHLCGLQAARILGAAAASVGIFNPRPEGGQVTPHVLRHSYARICKADGVPIEVIRDLLGHERASTTMDLYGSYTPKEAAEKWGRSIGF